MISCISINHASTPWLQLSALATFGIW